MSKLRIAAAVLALNAALVLPAHALQALSVSPQGESAQVRQVVVKFDDAAVNFGDPKAAAPFTLHCSDAQASRGTPRWNSEREWVYQFDNDLPPGVSCTLQPTPGFASPKAQPLAGKTRYAFNTGGPFVQRVAPSTYNTISEDQYFILQLNGAATLASLQRHTWCAVDGVGERVPVKLIAGKEREALLKSRGLTAAAAKNPLNYATLTCNRRLTAGSTAQLVYGVGVQTPSGVPNSVEKSFEFKVRDPFLATFSCERPNAHAACLPMRPMTVNFNAQVPRKLAEAVRLSAGKTVLKPVFDKDDSKDGAMVGALSFKDLFAENTEYVLSVPKELVDDAGRSLSNAANYPLKVATGPMPPLAKFAAAPFGILERFAEPPADGKGELALLPVTVRNVEAALRIKGLTPGGKVSDLSPRGDTEIMAWFRKVQRYDAEQLARDDVDEGVQVPAPLEKNDYAVQTRMLSLLSGQPGVKTLDLPKVAGADPRPFEVVGIPLKPGFHVLEIASQKLGDALLDARHGKARTMYVRTSVLVTNLGVHFKLGRDNALAWVTSLDKGAPVAGAKVRVLDCGGEVAGSAVTDSQGIARFADLSPQPPRCERNDEYGGGGAYFVSARATSGGVEDLAFTWSDWNKGIEPWRFNVPTSADPQVDELAHTIFDRTLFRAGETVSMKHILRSLNRTGFGLAEDTPATLVITHEGSGQQYTQPLAWRRTATGGQSAESTFAIPPAAKLGVYTVELRASADLEGGHASTRRRRGEARNFSTGQFRVEEFRLPVFQGRVAPSGGKPLVNVKSVPADVQINFLAGGGAANLPVRVSALVRAKSASYTDYDDFSFAPPQRAGTAGAAGNDGDIEGGEEEAAATQDQRVIADKLAVTLDRNGVGKVVVNNVPVVREPRELLLEATYADPNGEVQSLRSTSTLWPAAVVAGLKTDGWVSTSKKMKFQALALDLGGKPAPGTALEVRAIAHIVNTSRKRMVGGFYTYDNATDTKDLGSVCSGKSDSRGLLLCETTLGEPGQVELVVTAKDKDGNSIQAASSVYVTKHGEVWFGGEDHDRIDVLPEKKSYQPGDTAKFQVRMPFRFATALVAVEREGILQTQVVKLEGDDPTISMKVGDNWGPNVYISVLALRGRLREVPWYSFFTWGYKAPREWWTSFWYEGREYTAPSALVDLSKPAYRLGMAEIRVGTKAHQLDVSVKADKDAYPVRGQARVTITVRLPNGKPAARAEVALAAVDQALLELMPNASWNLLDAMLQRRSWGVQTATAQMEIIGRRHYGRKAVPAGGGGGHGAARELLDTLLLWNPRVQLDANGQAQVTVPLNDALTSFKIVAVADAATGLFGTGQASIRATQDLQIISGLPPLVREDDQFRAQLTLRNTTKAPMKVDVIPRASMLTLAPQLVEIPPGESREVAWNVTAPAQLAFSRSEAILWEVEAKDRVSGARDALKMQQRIVPAVPLTVQQATLVQVDGKFTLDVNPPADALPGRGGLKMSLQPKLAEGMDGIRDWFIWYPYNCLEQQTSVAMGLRDAGMWKAVVAKMPSYLDADGLANYFPPRGGEANRGSDTLTAYILAATQEAAGIDPALALPDSVLAPMQNGLIAFVEGRIQRGFWSPRKDLDVRKLAALEALSRYGKAQAGMLGSITIAPNQWPTGAVIDWFNILKRVADVPQRDQRLAEATQILKSRLTFQGTRMGFNTEKDDYWWWLMSNGDVNTARLMLAVMDDPAWQDDMGRLANGFIGRQQKGAWLTTTANLWGGLALTKFSLKFEATPVAGITRATLASAADKAASVDWAKVQRVTAADAGGAAHLGSVFGAPAAPGNLRNNTMFLGWGPKGKDTLTVSHQGSGKPWMTLQSVAAVPLKAPFNSGYEIKKTVTPVEQAVKGVYSRGDLLRVTLEVNASADMTWVVINDPIPGGATIMGNGLGRDSDIAGAGEQHSGSAWQAFEERSFEAYRSYYEYLPKGVIKLEYTVRLNNVGDFAMPPTRVEAMYAPEMFGEAPNARVKVQAVK